jgi:hypothetical protein
MKICNETMTCAARGLTCWTREHSHSIEFVFSQNYVSLAIVRMFQIAVAIFVFVIIIIIII